MPDPEILKMFILCWLGTIFMAFLVGRAVWKHERRLVQFYHALREKYPRSYVKPNKVIRFVRKYSGVETRRNETVHWMICLFHYLQLVILFSPVLALLLLIFIPLEKATLWLVVMGFILPGLICMIERVLFIIQGFRCDRIQKKDPTYGKWHHFGRGGWE